MHLPKSNKWPSVCSVCGNRFGKGEGWVIFERTSQFTQGRGRPEGKFVAFCNAHYQEAKTRLNSGNNGSQEIPQEESNESTGTLGEILNKAIEAKEEAKEVSPPPPATVPQDKEGIALDIAQLIAKLASNPGVNKEEVNKLIDNYVTEHGVATMADIHRALDKVNQTPPSKVEIIKGDDKQIIETGLHHYLLPDIIKILSQGLHIYLVGPAGAGKTTLANQAAKTLEKAFYFTGALDSKYGLIGFRDAHGNYHRTPFREAFEHGGVFLFDEVDASSANAMLSFNAALANGHMDFPDGIVERHPDFVAIASANTFGNGQDRLYVGRNQLDAATLDRFVTVEMNYDEKLEKALVGTDRKAIAWVEFVQRTRKAVSDLKLRYVVSPRASLQGSKLLLAGMDTAQVAKMVLYRSMKPEDVAKVQGYAPIPR